jgi:hypothetical protein
MSQPFRLCLKHPNGWFAAGAEMQQALIRLSDGAFKRYVYLCLHANRRTGQFAFRQQELARALDKSERSIATCLDELRHQQVCLIEPAPNQHQPGRIEIGDPFWPYHKEPGVTVADPQPQAFVAQVRRLFLEPACVQATFTPADEKLALDWYRRGLALEQVERAIRLGCARKYMALCNWQAGSPITSLHYFAGVLEEVITAQVSPGYWDHVAAAARRMETRWRAGAKFAPAEPAPQGETK